MFDIGKHQVPAKCPACGHSNQVTLEQVSRQSVITCHSCRQRIALKDSGRSVGKSINDLNKSVNDIGSLFKKLR